MPGWFGVVVVVDGGLLAASVGVAFEDESWAADWSRSMADWARSGSAIRASHSIGSLVLVTMVAALWCLSTMSS